MSKINVLVVDDSAFMRGLISRFIEKDNTLQVIGAAQNGEEAIKLVKELQPDVVTMDIEMPGMNGLDALETIMWEQPTPVIMLSSLTQKGANETMIALQSGAIDFVAKPSGSISADLFKVNKELICKIKLAAKTPQTALSGAKRNQSKPEGNRKHEAILKNGFGCQEFNQIVAVGTSTGGPQALETVITSLPDDFPCPVLVVQHMPPNFTRSLAQRLDHIAGMEVLEAEDNMLVKGQTVYIAPGDYHMTITEGKGQYWIRLHKQPPRKGHRPSVDVLFDSVSKLGLRQHYIIMTGMGSDGADGMLRAKQRNVCTTIAESEETCIVYGMPKSAIERGCVDYIVPIDKIALKIVEVAGR